MATSQHSTHPALQKALLVWKYLEWTVILTLTLVVCMELPSYLSMREVGLGGSWLASHFSLARLPQYLLFVSIVFALIHGLVLCFRKFVALYREDKALGEDGDE